jgi:hypothetical protein
VKRFVILAVTMCVVSTLGLAIASGTRASAKESSPFVGEWKAIDILAGSSYMQMRITGHQQPSRVKLASDWEALCPEGGPATVMGKVTYSDLYIMLVDLQLRCQVGSYRTTESFGFQYFDDDTLRDWQGRIWTRM